MEKLTKADYQNLFALLNNAQISGAQAEVVVVLKQKLALLLKEQPESVKLKPKAKEAKK